jgi:hypothetical protein
MNTLHHTTFYFPGNTTADSIYRQKAVTGKSTLDSLPAKIDPVARHGFPDSDRV